jgi:hypothetical protein
MSRRPVVLDGIANMPTDGQLAALLWRSLPKECRDAAGRP